MTTKDTKDTKVHEGPSEEPRHIGWVSFVNLSGLGG
jgi:hypothetical protein